MRRVKSLVSAVPDQSITELEVNERNVLSLGLPQTMLLQKYKLPDQLRPYIRSGFLEVLAENEAEKTVEFHIPALRQSDADGRITTYSLTWIHPDHNEQFCHYYDKVPGDTPNFYLTKDVTELGDEIVDINSVDQLVSWLESHRG